MPTVQSIGGQPGVLALLLLIMLFWMNGCQSLATPSVGTGSSETGWEIAEQAGPVWLRSPGQSFWHGARPGVRIAPGSQVATFDDSRLEVASAGDKVTVSGPSRFTLPQAERDGVRVRQDAGSLRYKVQSAPERHFEVKTPHFSTVVKGTIFVISIDRTSSKVLVIEGRVLILDVNGEPLAELTAGQIGRLAAQPGAALEVSTAPAPSFERSTAPGAGLEPSAHGNARFPQTIDVTSASLGAPITEAGAPNADVSLLERIESVLSDMAVWVSSGNPVTSQGVVLNNDRGGGAREQEGQSGGMSTDKDKTKGNGKGKHNAKGKHNGQGKDHDRGRGRGFGDGGANIMHEHDDRDHLIAWSERP
jgi:hypothetical protein